MLRGRQAAMGLPRPRDRTRGSGEGRGPSLLLQEVLRRAGVRHGAPGVPRLQGGGGDPIRREGSPATIRGRPLGWGIDMSADLMYQAELKEAVRHAYSGISSGGGEAVARRLYSEEELA